MAILLSRSYKGVPSGNTASFTTDEELALVAQSIGTSAALSTITAGAMINNSSNGVVAFAAAATSLVVTNSLVDANSKIYAVINQATADTTFTFVARIVPAAGLFTIFANAGATAQTLVSWSLLNPAGLTAKI